MLENSWHVPSTLEATLIKANTADNSSFWEVKLLIVLLIQILYNHVSTHDFFFVGFLKRQYVTSPVGVLPLVFEQRKLYNLAFWDFIGGL